MDRDDVLRLAREAGLWSDLYMHWVCSQLVIEYFAALVRAEVLEEAAVICLRLVPRAGTVYECVDAIRAAKEGS